MIQDTGEHLPVYKVQLIGKTIKFRVFHRNLLFPLTMRNESDEKQQIMEANEPKQTDLDEENDASSEQINNYKGPVTRSKTKKMENTLLPKASMFMANPFNDK